MIAQVVRGPHSIYRRYQALLESLVTAAAFAGLVVLALLALNVYPYNWVLVIGFAIGVLGVRWPPIAYIVSVVALLYPIYSINLYLAVLFLAICALGHRMLVHYLGATTLVLATPFLAQYHLHWLVPILGGLWWGGVAGAWIGVIAALWGKIIAGMAGLNIDWLFLAGQVPDTLAIADRFEAANSLETLLLLIEPFAATPSVILYNLLQILGWALAGSFVGSLAGRQWVKYRTPWSVLVVTAGGGLIMLATHIGLPYWLNDAVSEAAIATPQDPTAPLFSLIVVIIVGTVIYTMRESLDLPVAPKRKAASIKRKQGGQKTTKIPGFNFFKRPAKVQRKQVIRQSGTEAPEVLNAASPRPARVPHQSELPEWEPPSDESGLIMLEID